MDMMNVLNARITFRKAPIHVLEKFAFKDLDSAYRNFKNGSLKECVILQTCNRVEVYAAFDGDADYKDLLKPWAKSAGISPEEFKDVIEVGIGNDVVSHLLKLAAGLDSLVIGEDQILGQVKRAYDLAMKNKTAGPYLEMLFDRAVKAGSRVRTSTGINKGTVSYGSMAVKLVEEHVKSLRGRKILLIGSGEAASLVAKALKRRKTKFFVTSRTLDRSQSFAETVGGEPIAFEDALGMLTKIDVLFVATTAPYYLVTVERISSAMQKRRRGMVIVDLSNPRTVEEKIAALKGVKLINIDEVAALVEKNIRARMHEVKSAKKIIDEESCFVEARMKRLAVEPLVDSLFRKVDAIRRRELEKALQMLDSLSEEERRVIEQLSHAIVEGVLSSPMDELRRSSEDGDKELVKAVSKLFKYEW